MTALRLLVAVVACTASVGGVAVAASLTVTSARLTGWSSSAGCVPGTSTVGAEADSYVDQDNPSSNFGSGSSLIVRSPILSIIGIDIGGRARALVRFPLPGIGLCSVTSASLRLYATASSAGRTLEALRVGASWAESTVTWSNQPATTGAAVTTTSGTGWRTWTVTSQVQDMYSGSNHGFLVRDTTAVSLLAAQQTYNSRTAASNQPELVVTYG